MLLVQYVLMRNSVFASAETTVTILLHSAAAVSMPLYTYSTR